MDIVLLVDMYGYGHLFRKGTVVRVSEKEAERYIRYGWGKCTSPTTK